MDPSGMKTDEEIYEVLREVQLLDHIQNMEQKLDTEVKESNNLFSVGQK